MTLLLIYLSLCVMNVYAVSISRRSEESSTEWDFGQSARDLVDSQWNEFKFKIKKHYKDETEELRHKKIFIEESIARAKRNQLFAKGAGCYAELTQSDIDEAVTFIPPAHVTLPDKVNWTQDGAVTDVKNQGTYCQSCYAFAATGALEAQHFRKYKELVSLSEQNLIDCSQNEGNNGCNKGNSFRCYKYIQKNDGIDTDASYKYEFMAGECRYNKSNKGATDMGYAFVYGEDNLKVALATTGPFAVGIDAPKSFIDFYSMDVNVTKVYYEPECNPKKPVHEVLVVGYGTDPEDPHPDYWIVKNSWGDFWGDKGYIKMARNVDNDCGISTSGGSYPLV